MACVVEEKKAEVEEETDSEVADEKEAKLEEEKGQRWSRKTRWRFSRKRIQKIPSVIFINSKNRKFKKLNFENFNFKI